MEAYINHIESQLKGERENKLLYEFKRQLLNDMNIRANELTHTGLNNPKVLSDLVISEHNDIKKEYKKFKLKKTEKKRKKRAIINNILFSIIFILATITAYLAISFSTMAWAKTWLILDGAFSIWIAFEFSLLIHKTTKSSKKLLNPVARILLATNVMLITQFVFFFYLLILNMPKSWIIFIFGIILMILADALYTTITRQKLIIINYLFYILLASPMVYIIISAAGIVPWSIGWLIIPIAILIDLIIVTIKVIIHEKRAINKEVEQ